jgi:4'-phosphopantetheinyl transferase
MPIIKEFEILEGCRVAVWEITETLDWFQNQVFATDNELVDFQAIAHPVKQLEWFAGRAALQHLVWPLVYDGLVKDQYGKPHLRSHEAQISVTHTSKYVAVAFHSDKPVGIDVERVSEKIGRIAHKFLNDQELTEAGNDLDKLAAYWCAKEALYKLHGTKQLSFKQNIAVEAPSDFFKGQIHYPNQTDSHKLYRFWIDDFCGVLAV